MLGVLMPGAAQAFAARICNAGDTQIAVAVVAQTEEGLWSIEGWLPRAVGECVQRGQDWSTELFFAYLYRDRNGLWGAGDFTGVGGLMKQFHVSQFAFCTSLTEPFYRIASQSELTECLEGQTPQLFPIYTYGEGKFTFEHAVRPDADVLHPEGVPEIGVLAMPEAVQ
ncbi:hypothetical protein ACM25N_05475 [Roseovarius sp. C7]|uniref:hypothetical protein n=1 Tax=Roseovarius sp. C7 TaxID=3398643 RepID=UPI0039F72558